MGDYTNLQLFVHDCPDDQAAALVEVIIDHELHVDWDGPLAKAGELHIGTPYTSRGATGDESEHLADALIDAAPGASFTTWTDPKYEWLGVVVRYTPDLGRHQADCDQQGQAVFGEQEILRAIGNHPALAAFVGAPWTRALTGSTEERTINYEVPEED